MMDWTKGLSLQWVEEVRVLNLHTAGQLFFCFRFCEVSREKASRGGEPEADEERQCLN
jgi:hypothetical protein